MPYQVARGVPQVTDGIFGEIIKQYLFLVESGVPWATDGNFGKMNNVWSLEDIWIFRQLMGILGQ